MSNDTDMRITVRVGGNQEHQISAARGIDADPSFDSNVWHTSDRDLARFTEATGLNLDTADLQTVRNASAAYEASYPNAFASVWGKAENHHLARLVWLAWWLDWAARNEAEPTIKRKQP